MKKNDLPQWLLIGILLLLIGPLSCSKDPLGPKNGSTSETSSPNAPSDLSITGHTGNMANLAFTDNSDNEDGSHVYANGGLYKTLGANVTTFQAGPACGSTYSINVTAYNTKGESDPSNTVDVEGVCPAGPNAPSNLSVTGTTGNMRNLAFTDNSNDEDGFRVYANGGLYKTLGPNVTTFQAGPACGSTYSIYVTAYNTEGESDPSNTVDVEGVCPAGPDAPSNLSVTGTTGNMRDMAFTDNSDNEDGFRVYANGGLYKTLGPNVTTFQVGPACGSTYSIYVTAYNTEGESDPSNTVNVAGVCPTAPNAPSSLSVTGTTGSMRDMAFTDNSDNEDGFRVYANGGLYRTLGPNVTTFQVGPACGSTYSIYVTAYNTEGESDPSNTVNVQGVCP